MGFKMRKNIQKWVKERNCTSLVLGGVKHTQQSIVLIELKKSGTLLVEEMLGGHKNMGRGHTTMNQISGSGHSSFHLKVLKLFFLKKFEKKNLKIVEK